MTTATIVSVAPFPFERRIPGISPAYYYMKAAVEDDLEVLVIKDGFTSMYIDMDRGYMRRPLSGMEIATALVHDYKRAQLAFDPNAYPGMFVVEGEASKELIMVDHEEELVKARSVQLKWFSNLVKLADDDWGKHKQHRMISDLQRSAAAFLRLQREWLYDPANVVRCSACNSEVDLKAAICKTCRHIINRERYEELEFAPTG